MRKADLARLLEVHQPQVDRLFDLNHASKMDMLSAAAGALGRRLTDDLVL
jgi:antitoxin HicB